MTNDELAFVQVQPVDEVRIVVEMLTVSSSGRQPVGFDQYQVERKVAKEDAIMTNKVNARLRKLVFCGPVVIHADNLSVFQYYTVVYPSCQPF